MSLAEPDTGAIARHIARITGTGDVRMERHIALGFAASADAVEAAAGDAVTLEVLRRNPVEGLRRIAASLRKAAPK